VSGDGAPRLLVGTGSDRRHLIVVATSDRGLAGGFNSSIVRAARERIQALLAEGKAVSVLTVGRKARDQMRRLYSDRSVGAFEVGGNPSLAVAEAVAGKIRELFEAGEVDVVTLFYSRFGSVISQVPTAKQLIPAEVAAGAPVVDLKGAAYEYEPDEASILEELLPRNLTTQVFAAMLENQAGFFAAQMTAMDNATRNAGDMIASLTLQMNRARQAQITKELIEIISGAEAI
jgi:F-type H+-transporting ATPase subunit gamma